MLGKITPWLSGLSVRLTTDIEEKKHFPSLRCDVVNFVGLFGSYVAFMMRGLVLLRSGIAPYCLPGMSREAGGGGSGEDGERLAGFSVVHALNHPDVII